MPLRIMLVDCHQAHRDVVSKFVATYRPEIDVRELDPSTSSKTCSDIDWARYDLVVMDIRLGKQSGMDWMADILKVDKPPAVVFLSSQNNVEVAVEAMKAGASDYIPKKGIRARRLMKMLKDFVPEVLMQDFMPDLKPLPDNYDTQKFKVNKTEAEEVDSEEYWDQQTQVLYNPPKIK